MPFKLTYLSWFFWIFVFKIVFKLNFNVLSKVSFSKKKIKNCKKSFIFANQIDESCNVTRLVIA